MGLDTKTYWLTDRQSQCEKKEKVRAMENRAEMQDADNSEGFGIQK
jgi:hypothetical protein